MHSSEHYRESCSTQKIIYLQRTPFLCGVDFRNVACTEDREGQYTQGKKSYKVSGELGFLKFVGLNVEALRYEV